MLRTVKEKIMNGMKKSAIVPFLLATLTACSGMTARDRNTAIGAGAGAVAGSVLTSGSSLGTVGGAAVGCIIDNHVGR